jgi:hypothetical protein
MVFYLFLTLWQNYKITINLNNKPNPHFDLSSIKINKYTTILKQSFLFKWSWIDFKLKIKNKL